MDAFLSWAQEQGSVIFLLGIAIVYLLRKLNNREKQFDVLMAKVIEIAVLSEQRAQEKDQKIDRVEAKVDDIMRDTSKIPTIEDVAKDIKRAQE